MIGPPKSQLVSARSRSARLALLGVILAVAFVIRLIGLDWGLPYLQHPDEEITLTAVITMTEEGDLNPRRFDWASLPLYIQTVPFVGYVGIGNLLGTIDGWNDVRRPEILTTGSGILEDPTVLRIARLTTSIFSLGVVALGFFVATWITDRVWVGGVAGALLALEPILVRNSRWATPDTFATLFAFGAVAAAIAIYRTGRVRFLILGGLMVGLAAASKYNLAICGVAIAAADLLRLRRFGQDRSRGGLLIPAGVAVATFVVTTPYLLVSPSEVLGGVGLQMNHYAQGHPGAEGDQGLFYLMALWSNLGPWILLAPLGFAAPRLRNECLILASFPVVHLALLLSLPVRFERTILPALSPIVVLVAIGCMVLVERFSSSTIKANWALPIGLGLAVLMSVPLLMSLADDVHRYSIDHRSTAREWLETNIPPGTSIGYDAYSPYLDDEVFVLEPRGLLLESDRILEQPVDLIVLTGQGSGRFLADPNAYPDEARRFDLITDEFCLLRHFDGEEPISIWARDCSSPQFHP